MKNLMYMGKIIAILSVINWWKWKLDSRMTFPWIAKFPPVGFKKPDTKNFGWVQEIAYSYMEVSYISYCKKENFEPLDMDAFHFVFRKLFTDRYEPKTEIAKWYGYREYVDGENEIVDDYEYVEEPCYKIPNIYQCRALYEEATESSEIPWADGRRMKKSYRNSPEF